MKVTLVKPCGYCSGVVRAINLAKQAKEDNPDKNVYIFGMLVHNNQVTKMLEDLDIHTIDLSQVNPLKRLEAFTDNDLVIFTAHGHLKEWENILKAHNVPFIDATCSKVQQVLYLINESKEVIYIGKKGHPETVASLGASDNIHLYNLNASFDYSCVKSSSPLVINQTTLSFLELEDVHKDILKHLPNAIITNEICDATMLRQLGLKKVPNDTDTIIIIGSNESSNTDKLYQLAKSYHPTLSVYKVETLEDLLRYDLTSSENIVIASGTSTPMESIIKIKEHLERMDGNG